jgi:peptide/nickel transport system permease protein
MIRFIAGRLIQGLVSILVIATLVFLIVRLTGDPTSVMVPDWAPQELQDLMRQRLGLDQPLFLQYLRYIWGILTLDLGPSFNGRPVLEVLMEYLPGTVTLALASILVAAVLAVPLGLLSAIYRGSWIDTLARGIALFGQSLPSFWLAIMLILVFGVYFQWFPVAHRSGLSSYVLPAVAMGLAPVAGIVRLTRSSMLEVMDSDYVRMARAKGLPPHVIYIKHGLRSALIPVVTYVGLIIAAFFNGSVVVENVFAWPGVGKMVLDAVNFRDFPLVQGAVIMTCIFFILINLVVDLLYVLIDPRIRYRDDRP